MRILKSLKKDNKGASLIAVVIAMVFVVSIGVIIMNITLSNISMKEMELSTKSNFYSAEDVLETIKSSLTDNSAICLESAYVDILGRYSSSIRNANGVQKSFQAAYLDYLVKKYQTYYNSKYTQWIAGSDPNIEKSRIHTDGEFAMGYYDKNVLTQSLTGELKSKAEDALIRMDAGKAQFEADYSKGTFTLKNIHIIFTDTRGYETSISTDIIMTTPTLNFDGTNSVEEYMKYSIIADKQIYLIGSPQIKGNAYAGCKGIYAETGSDAKLTGNTVVTRGTIDVDTGATISIGDSAIDADNPKATTLWAENVRTSADGATVNLCGKMYISDDLSLDGENSRANLSGQYYGYNFQKLYTSDYVADVLNTQPVPYERDADFSSSIIINGSNSQLDMTGLSVLTLAGHSYVSKGNQAENSDIIMGESLAARTNQIEYNVSDDYLKYDTVTTVSGNRVSNSTLRFKNATEYETGDGTSKSGDAALSERLLGRAFSAGTTTPAIYEYVSQTDPLNIYYYRDGTDFIPRFYLKFESVEKANKFFAERASVATGAEGSVTKHIRKFLGNNDAIKISTTTYMTLAGSLMTVSSTGISILESGINSDEWTVPAVSGDALSIYARNARATARQYKSLQLDLTLTNNTVDDDNVRFPDNGVVKNDKTIDPLFYNLIDKNIMDNFLAPYADKTYDSGTTGNTPETARVVVKDNDAEYTPDFTYGVIIATGDVNLNSGFTGMILSGGKVKISAGTYSSDELMVSKLFEDDALRGHDSTFTTMFPTYNNLSANVLGVVQVQDYIGYDNWTKYAD